jgi:hypothetical protein
MYLRRMLPVTIMLMMFVHFVTSCFANYRGLIRLTALEKPGSEISFAMHN